MSRSFDELSRIIKTGSKQEVREVLSVLSTEADLSYGAEALQAAMGRDEEKYHEWRNCVLTKLNADGDGNAASKQFEEHPFSECPATRYVQSLLPLGRVELSESVLFFAARHGLPTAIRLFLKTDPRLDFWKRDQDGKNVFDLYEEYRKQYTLSYPFPIDRDGMLFLHAALPTDRVIFPDETVYRVVVENVSKAAAQYGDDHLESTGQRLNKGYVIVRDIAENKAWRFVLDDCTFEPTIREELVIRFTSKGYTVKKPFKKKEPVGSGDEDQDAEIKELLEERGVS